MSIPDDRVPCPHPDRDHPRARSTAIVEIARAVTAVAGAVTILLTLIVKFA